VNLAPLTVQHSHFFLLKLLPKGSGLLSRYSDSLRPGRSGDRIPVGARLSTLVQTGPGAHPTSDTVGTGSFPGIKRPERGVDHPSPSSAEVKERVELIPLLSLWAFVACSRVNFYYYALNKALEAAMA